MKTLQLPVHYNFLQRKNYGGKKSETTGQQIPTVKVTGSPLSKASKLKSSILWLNPDAPENLTVKEAIIRAAFVITMPMLSAVDWVYGTHFLIFIVPVIFYLEVTAFTLYCPIKALFSNYTHPSKYE